jgi:hypothetical protein
MALKFRRGTDSGRSAITPAEGEPIFTTDTKKLYVGDGSTAGGVAVDTAVSDGDKGDITVSSSGATWTIDNDAVTYAKIQNVSAASRLLGRGSASGSGDVEEITIGTGLTLTGTELSTSGGGSAPQIQVDTITSSGTWTKPAWGKYFRVYICGGGAGGGSGARQATSSDRYGGGGGAPAQAYWMEFTNTEITGNVSVTIGAGGVGGASVSTNSTNGANGTAGGATSFGSFGSTYTSNLGSGGSTSGGSRGSSVRLDSVFGWSNTYSGQNGSNSSPGTSSGLSNQVLTISGNWGGGGGAGAGGGSTTTSNGGTIDHWSQIPGSPAVSAGGTNGGNGNNGVNFSCGYATIGTPGGGGSYKTGQATGAGGNGGYGAGGGGGAASDNGFASGAGGNGGGGICIVVSIG